MNHIIKLSNVYLEDCFKWMYDLVIRDGGDGTATFICKNYEEIGQLFCKLYGLEKWLVRAHSNERISFMHDFEGFTFTSNKDIRDEYTFIVEEDCSEGFTPMHTSIIAEKC